MLMQEWRGQELERTYYVVIITGTYVDNGLECRKLAKKINLLIYTLLTERELIFCSLCLLLAALVFYLSVFPKIPG